MGLIRKIKESCLQLSFIFLYFMNMRHGWRISSTLGPLALIENAAVLWLENTSPSAGVFRAVGVEDIAPPVLVFQKEKDSCRGKDER